MFHCGVRSVKLLARNVYTDKDLAYNFVTNKFGKPVSVHSKAQYKSLLKANGLMDASPKEGYDHAMFRRKIIENDDRVRRKRIAEKISKKLGQECLLKYVPGAIKEATENTKKIIKKER